MSFAKINTSHVLSFAKIICHIGCIVGAKDKATNTTISTRVA